MHPHRPTTNSTSRSAHPCWSFPPQHTSTTQAALAHALGHESKELRRTAGTNIGVVVAVGGLAQWPELIALLVQCLEGSSVPHMLGGLDTLYKVHRAHMCGMRR